MKLIKPVAKFALATQILFPLLFSASSVASAVNTKQEKTNHREVLAKIQSNLPELTSKQTEDAHSMTGDELLAQGLNKSAQIISQDNSSDAAKNLAQSTAYGFVSNQMTNWLNQYGNATIQISSDKAFSGEYFLPFYETEDNLFFSQSKIQRQNEDRTTLNLGLGYRYFITNKMLGINSFYDHDLKNHNARWGLGAEFGADYIKLAANGYFRLTDWRESRLSAFHDYDERPANGFDIKAEGFLPSYPQLGANIKYEKYFGDKVNLKGSNSISDLKTNPQAYTIGISYTPVPLLSFSLNQSMGDVNETKGELAINYRFGVPLSKQLDTDLVQQMRTLMGARYNPVDRNNTIVMQYKKSATPVDLTKSTILASSATNLKPSEKLSVKVNEEVIITVTLKDKNGNLLTGKTVSINKASDSNTDSKINEITENSKGVYSMKTTSTKVGTDTFGFKVDGKDAESTVVIKYKVGGKTTIKTTNNGVVTVGDNVVITVTLIDDNNNPITGQDVGIIEKKENGEDDNKKVEDHNDGDYTTTVMKEKDGEYTFVITVNDKVVDETTITFNKGKLSEQYATLTPDTSIASEGQDVYFTAYIGDNYNNPITGKYGVIAEIIENDNKVDVYCITEELGEGKYGCSMKMTHNTNGTAWSFGYVFFDTESELEQFVDSVSRK